MSSVAINEFRIISFSEGIQGRFYALPGTFILPGVILAGREWE
jgi:hypothetical protein